MFNKVVLEMKKKKNHQRQDRADQQLNPIPYQADYFGHKLHVDQNEKLVI